MFATMQARDCGADAVHARFLDRFLEGRHEDVAALFAGDGVMRILDLADGQVMESAHGGAGIASLARSIHENIAFESFRAIRMRWREGRLDYAWSASVRNWGFGPTRRTKGRATLIVEGERIVRADAAVDADLYFSLVRPRPPFGESFEIMARGSGALGFAWAC